MNRFAVSLRPQWRQLNKPLPVINRDPLLFRKIRYRNRHERSAIVIISGDPGSGKSRFAGWMITSLDPRFVSYWQNGTPHISVSPIPFIQALKHDVLPPSSWWLIDEPRNVKNTNWQDDVSEAVRDVLTEYRPAIVNLAICTTMRKKLLNDIRDLANYWVRMESVGNCEIREFRTKIKWKQGEAVEIRVPRRIERILNVPMPGADFEELYTPERLNRLPEITDKWIRTFTKKGYID